MWNAIWEQLHMELREDMSSQNSNRCWMNVQWRVNRNHRGVEENQKTGECYNKLSCCFNYLS